MNQVKRGLLRAVSFIVLATVVASCSGGAGTQTTASDTVATAPVSTITSVTTVTGSGSTMVLQSVSVSWKSSGTVGVVNVKPGDEVKAGDPLMSIDPRSIPQQVIQAQLALTNAVKALNDLLHPSELTIANARQTVAKAQDTLSQAQKTLNNLKKPDVAYYQDQVQKAQDALTNAQQNATLVDIGQLPVQLRNAQDQLDIATNIYNDAQAAFAQCPSCIQVYAYKGMTTWDNAVNQYNDAVNKVQQIQFQIDQSQRQNSTSVVTAQSNLDTANNALAAAQQSPDAITLGLAEAAVAVAKANLADAQDKLDHLLNGAAPEDIQSAQVQVQIAQANLDQYVLTAPVAGEVLEVNFQPGDNASSATPAVVLVNRSHVRVDTLVDQTDVAKIHPGDPVTITIDALPNFALPATVTWIDPTGTTSQGLVKYTVRVDSSQTDPRVLVGMTASALIVTDSQAGVLAVPLQALQYDQDGEFVNRVQPDGSLQRVPVQSGQIQGNVITVAGKLTSGDQVELAQMKAATTNTGAGFGAMFGGGGGPGGR